MTTIILSIILIIGIVLMVKSDYEVLGCMIAAITSFFLLSHLISIAISGYNYKLFEAKRNAFESTLIEARANNNQYELAAITQSIVAWNQELAKQQYDNSTILLDPYIDDRIDSLKPIK